MQKKLFLPGSFLASSEEFIPGKNTFTEEDSILSSLIGEMTEEGKHLSISNKSKGIISLKEGDYVYCVVREIMENRAVVDCTPVELKGHRSITSFTAALPVTHIRKGYVKSIRDEVRIGDVLRARIIVTKPAADISILADDCGVLVAFCSRCRNRMSLKDDKVFCNRCENTESRKMAKVS